MWILPKQLHTSDFVPDTEALSLDLNESSQLCAQSLFVRSKPSPLRTWLQKWKRDSWTQHLYGRILRPSLGTHFVTAWTSSLEVTPASHSAQPGSDLEQKTQDTFGPTSQAAFDFFDQSSVSLKTSKDTSALDSEKSLQSWKALVTKRRGEYSQRLNAARLTSESESLSWPTCAARDYKGTSPGYLLRADGKSRVDQLPVAVDQAEAGNWPSPVASEVRQGFQDRSRGMKGSQESLTTVVVKYWPTPVANDDNKSPEAHLAMKRRMSEADGSNRTAITSLNVMIKALYGPPVQVNHSTHGNRLESWATPEGMAGGKISRGGKRKGELLLTGQVKQDASGKLNPRWVETLMGLLVGWTMPSCQSPVTIGQTNCASLETE